MKKNVILALIISVLSLGLLTACGSNEDNSETDNKTAQDEQETTKLTVAASPVPHSEILEETREILAKDGYELEIIEYTDYILPNNAVAQGEIDANFHQHQPYLDNFNEENGTDIVSVTSVHYEPFGIYAGKSKSIEELEDGASIAVPSDTTNEARALLLLESEGIIELAEDAGLNATANDISNNPKNIEIIELEAAQIPRALPDVDLAVINGNYAIDAGLKVSDAIATEDKDSLAAETYANVVGVKSGNEDNEAIKALVEALRSDHVKQFIEDTYEGAVVPIF